MLPEHLHTFAGGITYVGSAYGLSTVLASLDDTVTGTEGPARMANLQFVPEPSRLVLLGLAAFGLVVRRRRVMVIT